MLLSRFQSNNQRKEWLQLHVIEFDTQDIKTYIDQSFVHCSQISSFLHRDETKMILFVDPRKERFVVVVEDTPTNRPIIVAACCFQKSFNK